MNAADNRFFIDTSILLYWMDPKQVEKHSAAPSAASKFLAATAGGAALGLLLGYALTRLGIVAGMMDAVAGIPGAVGETLGYVAQVTPYILFVILAMAPTLVVRAARRERVEAIEQETSRRCSSFWLRSPRRGSRSIPPSHGLPSQELSQCAP